MYTVRRVRVPGRLGWHWLVPAIFSPTVSLLLAYFWTDLSAPWARNSEPLVWRAALIIPLALNVSSWWGLRRLMVRPAYYLFSLLPLYLMSLTILLILWSLQPPCMEDFLLGRCLPPRNDTSDVGLLFQTLAISLFFMPLIRYPMAYLQTRSLRPRGAMVIHMVGYHLISEVCALSLMSALSFQEDGSYRWSFAAWLAYWLISGGATGRGVERWVAREAHRGQRRLHFMRARLLRPRVPSAPHENLPASPGASI
jgi:hypothetical protein